MGSIAPNGPPTLLPSLGGRRGDICHLPLAQRQPSPITSGPHLVIRPRDIPYLCAAHSICSITLVKIIHISCVYQLMIYQSITLGMVKPALNES